MAEPLILKKYSNRRLYDTEQSTYVTLEQVAEMIKSGRTIKVIEATSKEDVTSFILNQIILEESKKHAMLPASLLHLIIRYGDNLLSDFFDQYLEETLKIYVNSKMTFDNYFRQWLKMGMDFSGTHPPEFSDMSSFADIFQMFGATREKTEKGPDETDREN